MQTCNSSSRWRMLLRGMLTVMFMLLAASAGPGLLAQIVIDDFNTGAFSTSGLINDLPASGTIGGMRDVHVLDSGVPSTPSVMSLTPGNGYLNLAIGNLPGNYSIGWGSLLFGGGTNLNFDASSYDRVVVTLSQAPSSGIMFVTFEKPESPSFTSTVTLPLSGAGDYTFLFSSFFGVDLSDIDGISLIFAAGVPAGSTIRIESIVTGSPVLNLSIDDVSLNEGDAGTTSFDFTVSLTQPAGAGGVTFAIATADGTAQDDIPATEDNDYVPKSLANQTIAAGNSTYTFSVTVNGDLAIESNETFFVNVSAVSGATLGDGQGLGTITNDDVVSPEMDVQGNSTSIADGDNSPDTGDNTDFGSADVTSGTVSRSFTLHNTSGPDLNLTGTPKVQISGAHLADFTVTLQPSSPLSAGTFTIFAIQFNPSASGLRTATVSIDNNDSDEHPYNFAIQGTGTVVCIPSGPPVFDNCSDGTTYLGCSPAPSDIPGADPSVTASDNCGAVTVLSSITNETNARVITYTATNSFGVSTCTQIYTWSIAVPTIDTPPTSQTACVGSTASFSVVSNVPIPTFDYGLTYQWRKGGAPLTNGGNISGATTATLTINPTAAGDAGSYDVVVTNACGPTTSTAGALTVPVPAVSISGDDPVTTGTTHTYAVNTNASSPSYSWSVTGGSINGSNTGNSISVTAGGVGTMEVSVTVTDGATTCSNSATKNVTVEGTTATSFVFVTNHLIKINQNKISEGDIQSNYGDIIFGKGAPGTHTGNLFAGDDIVIDKQNTIVGNATAEEEIRRASGATITGSTNPHTNIDAETLPNPSFSAGGPNKTVRKNTSLTLSPGSYGTVKVETNGTLKLSAGNYYMKVLITAASTKIAIEASGGEVKINIVSKLVFGQQTIVEITGGGTEEVTFATLQDEKVQIGQKSVIRGTLIARHAEVHFDKECKFKGTVYAESISLDAKVQFYPHGSSSFFKENDEEDSEEVISEESSVISDYVLEQNYPNPFNPTTVISFALPQTSEVTLAIYSTNGQLVKQLVAGEMSAGQHSLVWDAKDEHGTRVASGVYLYVIKAGEFTAQRKLVLMK